MKTISVPVGQTPVDTLDDAKEALGESMESFKKKSVSGALSYVMRSLVLYAVGLGSSAVLSAYLSAVEFGVYGIVTQVVGLLQFFSDVGLGPTLIQQKQEPTETEYGVVFTLQQFLGWFIAIAAILVALTPQMQSRIGMDGAYVLIALGLSFPLSALKTIPAIKLERKLDFSSLVIPSLWEQMVYNVVLVGLVLSGWGVRSYAVAVMVRAVVGVIAMYVVSPWKPVLSLESKSIKAIFSVGMKFQASDILAKIKDQIFYLIIGFWLPLEQFGMISWAKGWSQVPYMLTVQNVIAITFPAYSRLQHDSRLLKRAIEKSIFFICVSIFPLLIGMSVFIWPVIGFVQRYHKWEPALFTFVLFTLSIGWAAVSTPLTNALNAMGKIHETLRLMVMWTVLTWVVTPITIRLFGYEGVAIASMIIAVSSVVPVFVIKKYIDLDVWGQVRLPLAASCAMTAVAVGGLPIWSLSWAWVFAGGFVSVMVYLLVLLLLGKEKVLSEVASLRTKL